MSEVIFIIKESAEGGFEARALDYSIYTEAKDMESLKEAVKDAVLCHFGKKNTPKLIRLHLVKDELITI
jgi:hypothetical protein